MRSYGKQIVVITLAQSLVTFLVVSVTFSAIFYFMDIPVFPGLIFGGIALATAPAPALSIVTEYKTDGPVTKTLIPLVVIDGVIAICVFLSVMGVILQKNAGGSLPGYLPVLVVLFPVLIGVLTGSGAALCDEVDFFAQSQRGCGVCGRNTDRDTDGYRRDGAGEWR